MLGETCRHIISIIGTGVTLQRENIPFNPFLLYELPILLEAPSLPMYRSCPLPLPNVGPQEHCIERCGLVSACTCGLSPSGVTRVNKKQSGSVFQPLVVSQLSAAYPPIMLGPNFTNTIVGPVECMKKYGRERQTFENQLQNSEKRQQSQSGGLLVWAVFVLCLNFCVH